MSISDTVSSSHQEGTSAKTTVSLVTTDAADLPLVVERSSDLITNVGARGYKKVFQKGGWKMMFTQMVKSFHHVFGCSGVVVHCGTEKKKRMKERPQERKKEKQKEKQNWPQNHRTQTIESMGSEGQSLMLVHPRPKRGGVIEKGKRPQTVEDPPRQLGRCRGRYWHGGYLQLVQLVGW